VSYGVIRKTFTATLSSTSEVVFSESLHNAEFATVEIEVTGDPLSSFSVNMRGHCSSSYSEMFTTAADYLDPKGLMRGSSGDLTSINGKGWVMLDTRGIDSIQIKASSSGSSEITIHLGG